MTLARLGYSIPTLNDFTFMALIEAKNSGVANLLSVARRQLPNLSLYEPYAYYKGECFKFFYDLTINKQNFERTNDVEKK